MKRKQIKPIKPRELATLGMILTRKGGPMKDKRLKRTSRSSIERERTQEQL